MLQIVCASTNMFDSGWTPNRLEVPCSGLRGEEFLYRSYKVNNKIVTSTKVETWSM